MTSPHVPGTVPFHPEEECFDPAMKEVKLPKYESWGRYNEFLPMNVERLCYYWRNGSR